MCLRTSLSTVLPGRNVPRHDMLTNNRYRLRTHRTKAGTSFSGRYPPQRAAVQALGWLPLSTCRFGSNRSHGERCPQESDRPRSDHVRLTSASTQASHPPAGPGLPADGQWLKGLAWGRERELFARLEARQLQEPRRQFKRAPRPSSANRDPKRTKVRARLHHRAFGVDVGDIDGELQEEGVDGKAGLDPYPAAHEQFIPPQESHGSRYMTVRHLHETQIASRGPDQRRGYGRRGGAP